MDEKTIRERIETYRQSRAEWMRRAAACEGAIEALEGLLPATPIEDVVHAIGGEIK